MAKIIKGTHEFDKEPTVNGNAVLTAASVLNDLNNVNAPSPSTDDALVWNGSMWVPGSISGGFIKSAFTELTVDTTTTTTSWGTTLLSINITPASSSNYFLVHFDASGDASGGSDSKTQFRLLMGLTGSETVRRSTYMFNDAATWETGSCSLTYRGQAAGAGQHTIIIQWKLSASDTARIQPATQADYDHASLLVQEVTG